MIWQLALPTIFIVLAAIGAVVIVFKISIGVWHGQIGWIICGIVLVSFIAWFFWDARI